MRRDLNCAANLPPETKPALVNLNSFVLFLFFFPFPLAFAEVLIALLILFEFRCGARHLLDSLREITLFDALLEIVVQPGSLPEHLADLHLESLERNVESRVLRQHGEGSTRAFVANIDLSRASVLRHKFEKLHALILYLLLESIENSLISLVRNIIIASEDRTSDHELSI